MTYNMYTEYLYNTRIFGTRLCISHIGILIVVWCAMARRRVWHTADVVVAAAEQTEITGCFLFFFFIVLFFCLPR